MKKYELLVLNKSADQSWSDFYDYVEGKLGEWSKAGWEVSQMNTHIPVSGGGAITGSGDIYSDFARTQYIFLMQKES